MAIDIDKIISELSPLGNDVEVLWNHPESQKLLIVKINDFSESSMDNYNVIIDAEVKPTLPYETWLQVKNAELKATYGDEPEAVR
jgi:hypothetical protein